VKWANGKGANAWWSYVGKFSQQCQVAESSVEAGGPTLGEAQAICSASVQKAVRVSIVVG
jgi:hypothetical protein